jgi:SAM-dependent methyltransferase
MSEQATPTGLDQQAAPQTEYGSAYYSNYRGGGGPYERNERWLGFFGEVADGIIRDLHPNSVFDAGCAMGFLVEALRKRGVDASGADISEYAISQVHESVAGHCSVATLTEPLPGRYDLVACIEVLEHLPADETDRAVANLCRASDRVLFSSTPGDFGEPTHLNVQPPETWAAKFAEQGFFRDLERDFSYISPWAALYRRDDEPRAETIRRYDRSWWRLRREATELRESLLQSQERLAELETGGGVENRAELLQELDARNEEILRLRDLLIGMEAEMGTVRGRVVELEDRTKPLTSVKHRLGRQFPFAGKVIRGLMRLFRGQS